MSLKENSSYIKGLVDGLDLDLTTKEGKVISALVELCDKLCEKVDSLEETTDTLHDYIEEIDFDLGAVEEEMMDINDDIDALYDDEDYDEDYDDDDFEDIDDEDEDDDDDFVCVVCPHCGDTIYIENTVDPEDITCPSCQKPLVADDED